jgi:hypothetical protein
MDRTGSVIVNLARAIAVRALPITLDGLIRLKLRQLLLQMQLNFVGFFEGKAKIVETSIIYTSLNVGNLATLSNAVHPHKLDGPSYLVTEDYIIQILVTGHDIFLLTNIWI